MKKLTLLIALIFIAFSANADWKYITGADEGKFYYEPSSIKKTKAFTKVWVLVDFNDPVTFRGITYLSSKSLWQLNCSEEEEKTTQSLAYSGHMGTGQLVDIRNDKMDWASIVPQTNQELIFKLVCNKL